MGRPTRNILQNLGTPPDDLEANTFIVKVIGARGNSLYNVRLPPSAEDKLKKLFTYPEPVPEEAKPKPASPPATQKDDSDSDSESDESEDEVKADLPGPELVVEMPPKFRNTVFVKRGGFCVITVYQEIADLETTPELSSYKVHGDISNIIRNVREWQKYPYWPAEYKRQTKGWDISSDEESEEEDDE